MDHVVLSVLRMDVLGTSALAQSLAGCRVYERATVLPVSGSVDATCDAELSRAVVAGSAAAADARVVAKWVGASGCTQSGAMSSRERCVALKCAAGDDAIALELWLRGREIPFLGFGLVSDKLLGRVRLPLPTESASVAAGHGGLSSATRHAFTLELDAGSTGTSMYTGTGAGTGTSKTGSRGAGYLYCAM